MNEIIFKIPKDYKIVKSTLTKLVYEKKDDIYYKEEDDIYHKKAKKYLEDIINGIEIELSLNDVFYKKDSIFYFDYDKKRKTLYYDYSNIYLVLLKTLNYSNIIVIENLIKETFYKLLQMKITKLCHEYNVGSLYKWVKK